MADTLSTRDAPQRRPAASSAASAASRSAWHRATGPDWDPG